jgi:peptidoglycan/LPS O-acetylase OafA/YrhL
VDLFFVLSGFLITGILLDSAGKPRYWRNFYGRRVLRILPLYFAVVAVAAVFYREHGSYFLISSAFLANFAVLFGIAVPHGPGVFWSLAVEEHFYLLWPLVVRVAKTYRLLWVSAAIVIAMPAARGFWKANGGDHETMYVLSWFRFDGLALGAFLAAWVRSRFGGRNHELGLAGGLVALSLAVTAAAAPFGVFRTLSVASGALRFTQAQLVFGACIVAAYALRGSRITAPLRTRFAQISSDYSYCIYLVHVCIIDLMFWLEQSLGVGPPANGYLAWSILRTVVVATVSFGVAALSKKYLEDPFLRLKRYLT